MQRFVFVVVLACAGQCAVAQTFDCNTDAGQVGFLENGARTNPNCYNPVLGLIRGDSFPSLAEIQVVSETFFTYAVIQGVFVFHCITGMPRQLRRDNGGFLAEYRTVPQQHGRARTC